MDASIAIDSFLAISYNDVQQESKAFDYVTMAPQVFCGAIVV